MEYEDFSELFSELAIVVIPSVLLVLAGYFLLARHALKFPERASRPWFRAVLVSLAFILAGIFVSISSVALLAIILMIYPTSLAW